MCCLDLQGDRAPGDKFARTLPNAPLRFSSVGEVLTRFAILSAALAAFCTKSAVPSMESTTTAPSASAALPTKLTASALVASTNWSSDAGASLFERLANFAF